MVVVIIVLGVLALATCILAGVGVGFLYDLGKVAESTSSSMQPGFKRTPSELRARLAVLTAQSRRYHVTREGRPEEKSETQAKQDFLKLIAKIDSYNHEESSKDELDLIRLALNSEDDASLDEMADSCQSAVAMAWVCNYADDEFLVASINEGTHPEDEWVNFGTVKAAESAKHPPLRDTSEIVKMAGRQTFLAQALYDVWSPSKSPESALRTIQRNLDDPRAAKLGLPKNAKYLLLGDTPVVELSREDASYAHYRVRASARSLLYACGWGKTWADCDTFYSYFFPREDLVKMLAGNDDR